MNGPIGSLPIGVLHIGCVARRLEDRGCTTVGHLLAAQAQGELSLFGLAPASIGDVLRSLDCLVSSIGAGGVNWSEYCRRLSIQLIAPPGSIPSGRAFLASIPSMLEEVAGALDNPVDAALLLDRIGRVPGDRAPLESIASSARPAITRERVRQRESALLRRLTDALFWASYGELRLHFSPEILHWWALLRDEFGGELEVEFDAFVARLCALLEVADAELMRVLPVILAIVTGDTRVPASFRDGYRRLPAFSVRLCANDRARRVTVLRTGRHAAQLASLGIRTIGDLLDSASKRS